MSANNNPNSSLNDVLAELKKTYLAGLPARIELISQLSDSGRLAEVETEFHKLKGTGKTYGLAEVSRIGELAEKLCEQGAEKARMAVPLALELLRHFHTAKVGNLPFELDAQPQFQTLSKL